MKSEERRSIFVVTHADNGVFASDVDAFAGSLTHAFGERGTLLSLDDREFLNRRVPSIPTDIIYVPAPGPLPWQIWRARNLRKAFPQSRHVMVPLAPVREIERRWWMRPLRCPAPILVGSYRSLLAVSRMGLRGDVIPPGIDARTWRPAEARVKSVARGRHEIDEKAFVLLWEGDARDAELMLSVRRAIPEVTVVAFDTQGGMPESVKQRLAAAGVRVHDRPAPLIELYWLSDVFVFSRTRDIVDQPQGILRALATGLPVLARPVGGVIDFFSEGADLHYWSDVDALQAHARVMAAPGTVTVRDMSGFEWSFVADRIDAVLGRGSDRDLSVPGSGAAVRSKS